MLLKQLPDQLTPDLKPIVSGSRLKGAWLLVRGYRWPYLGAGLALGISTGARTASLLLIQYFVDSYLAQGDRTYALWLIALGFVVLAAIQGGFTFVSGTLAAHVAESIAQRLRNFVLDQLQRLPFAYHDEVQTGEMIQRATSDIDALRRFYAIEFVETCRILFLFVINFVAIYFLNPTLAWISIVVIPVILAMSVYFFRLISKAYEAYQTQEAVLTTTLQENLSGVRVVKAFARQAFEEDKFEEANIKKYERGKQLLLMHALYWPLSDLLCGVQMLGGYLVGAFMAINGTISVGTYLAYAGMLLAIIWPMRNLGRLVVEMSRGLVSFDRVAEIIRQSREGMTEPGFKAPARLQGELAFENVSFAYGSATPKGAESSPLTTAAHAHSSNGQNGTGKQNGDGKQNGKVEKRIAATAQVIDSHLVVEGETTGDEPVQHHVVALGDISFNVMPGQRVALLGTAGAGKSTLVNLLPRFYDYTGGRILLDGIELRDYSREYLRQQIGIVEQEPFLFSRTVRENITYGVGREIDQSLVEDAARAAAIHDVIMEKLPKGYDTLVGERGTTLSGGQKQRVAIARTLLKDPRILILDDSTSAVDTETEASIREALERLMENRTTFIIAHRIQSVMDADLILVLDKGRIIQAGTHDELIAQDGMYQRIYAAQTRIESELQKELNRVESA
jgi:ABC-type multidrug transport system fused ATPase/permease subunit